MTQQFGNRSETLQDPPKPVSENVWHAITAVWTCEALDTKSKRTYVACARAMLACLLMAMHSRLNAPPVRPSAEICTGGSPCCTIFLHHHLSRLKGAAVRMLGKAAKLLRSQHTKECFIRACDMIVKGTERGPAMKWHQSTYLRYLVGVQCTFESHSPMSPYSATFHMQLCPACHEKTLQKRPYHIQHLVYRLLAQRRR